MKWLIILFSVALVQINYTYGQKPGDPIDSFKSCLTNKIKFGHLQDHFKKKLLDLKFEVKYDSELSLKVGEEQTIPLLIISLVGLKKIQLNEVKAMLSKDEEGINYWMPRCYGEMIYKYANKDSYQIEISKIISPVYYSGSHQDYLIKRNNQNFFVVSFRAEVPSYSRK